MRAHVALLRVDRLGQVAGGAQALHEARDLHAFAVAIGAVVDHAVHAQAMALAAGVGFQAQAQDADIVTGSAAQFLQRRIRVECLLQAGRAADELQQRWIRVGDGLLRLQAGDLGVNL